MHFKMEKIFRLPRLFLLCLVFTFSPDVKAQIINVTLSGKILDAQNKAALPLATVILKTEKDSIFVAGTLSNEEGIFTFPALKKGRYLLEVTYLGYEIRRQPVLVGELSAFLD